MTDKSFWQPPKGGTGCCEQCRGAFAHMARRQGEMEEFFWWLLPRFQKNGVSTDILRRYSITFMSSGPGTRGAVYWDTPFGLVLTNDFCEVAWIGFQPHEENGLLIAQIQGSLGATSVLQSIRWERLLVTLLIELARKAGGYNAVEILPATSLRWFFGNVKDPGLAQLRARLKMRYDVTAQRMKFKWDETRKRYRFEL